MTVTTALCGIVSGVNETMNTKLSAQREGQSYELNIVSTWQMEATVT